MRYNFPFRELLEWHISVKGEGRESDSPSRGKGKSAKRRERCNRNDNLRGIWGLCEVQSRRGVALPPPSVVVV